MSHPDPKSRGDDASLRTTVGIPRRRSWVELSVGLAALVVSVASLFVARHQAQVMDRQLAASVWPLLEFSSSNATTEGLPRIALMLRNTGIGPLRIRSFRVTYEGQAIGSVKDFVTHCCARDSSVIRQMPIITSYIGGRVVPAGEGFDFISIRYDSAFAPEFRNLQRALSKVEARYCYCSVLDDCWIRESEHADADPLPVASCSEEHRARQFTL